MIPENFKQAMLQFLNIPYRWTGDDPMAGFDCSGLVQELLAILNLDPPGDQTAQQLMEYFKEHGIESLSPSHETGCLAFYGSNGKATHVAMFYDEHTILEAGGGGSKTLTIQDAIAQNAYTRLRNFMHRKDLLCVIKPDGVPW